MGRSRPPRRQLLASSPPPPPPPSRGRKRLRSEEVPDAARKILYILSRFQRSEPISQALYAIDASSSSFGTCSLQQVTEQPHTSPTLFPVIEFRRGYYPTDMCVAMLDTKLYFFGGHRDTLEEFDMNFRTFSKKAYCIDTTKTPLVCKKSKSAAATFIPKPTVLARGKNSLHSIMVRVASMHSGKRLCYGFVAAGKIYAVGSNVSNRYKSFEVYDPARDRWTPLSNPPEMFAVVDASAVFGEYKVIFQTTKGYFSYRFKEDKWDNYFCHLPLPRCPPFMGPAVFMGDTLYWDKVGMVGSLGTVTQPRHLLDTRCSFPTGDFVDHVGGFLPRNLPWSWLHQMGGNHFCYVMVGGPPDPLCPDSSDANGDPEKYICSIVVFEIPMESSGSGQCVRFEPKVLHAKRFYCRSRNGAELSYPSLKGCFSTAY